MTTANAITLSALQQIVGNSLRMNSQLQGVWVTAELSDVRSTGGHWYMELIEKNDGGATVAKCRANIWANSVPFIHHKFLAATGRNLSTGIKLMVRGSVTYHPLYGMSFNIVDIDPSYTLGDLERLRREILERLQREGVLDYNRSLQFPFAPQKIAVISAKGAAGYGDFMHQLLGNTAGFKFYPMLFQAAMQGERTAPSILHQLELIEATIDFWDCVVIIRGGGSTSDLNGFDNYELARAVATFPLPIVVGIGHERDRNVLDEIACIRCKTPTAVATFLIDSLRNAYDAAASRVDKIVKFSVDALTGEKHRLANIEASLPARIQTRLLRAEQRLSTVAHNLDRAVSRRNNREKDRLSMIASSIERAATRVQNKERENIGRLALRFENSLKGFTRRPAMKLENIENILRVLSPQNTLKRGYSITRINGGAVRSASSLKPGDIITTILPDGSVSSRVED